MRPPSRTRRVLKWIGLCLCALILVAWGMSLRRGLSYYHRTWRATLACSSISVLVTNPGGYQADLNKKFKQNGGAKWFVYAIRPYTVSDYGLAWPESRGVGVFMDATEITIPLWSLLLIPAIPTAWLWHRDRRKKRIGPGCCLRCGYDLKGNISGVCSECGLKRATS